MKKYVIIAVLTSAAFALPAFAAININAQPPTGQYDSNVIYSWDQSRFGLVGQVLNNFEIATPVDAPSPAIIGSRIGYNGPSSSTYLGGPTFCFASSTCTTFTFHSTTTLSVGTTSYWIWQYDIDTPIIPSSGFIKLFDSSYGGSPGSTSTESFAGTDDADGHYVLNNATPGTVAASSSPYLTFNGGLTGCDVPVDISLDTPPNGSTIVNDFTNWKLDHPTYLEGCSYHQVVYYQPDIGSLVPRTDWADITIRPDYNPAISSIPKSANIWNFYNATTTPIDYTLIITNKQDNYVVGSATGTFYLAWSATSSPSTAPPGADPTKPCLGVCSNFGEVGSGVGGGSIGTPTSTVNVAGSACVYPSSSDWVDAIGGGIEWGFCKTINFLFVPNETTKSIIAGDMAALQGVPPFQWFFATNDAIEAAANNPVVFGPDGSATYIINGQSVSSTPNRGVAFTIYSDIHGDTTTLTAMPADLTTNPTIGPFMVVWYNFILTLCVIVAVIALYKLVL